MVRHIAELKSVIDKWTGNFHIEHGTPHTVAIQMCKEFMGWLEGDLKIQEEQLKAQKEQEEPKAE
jgi:hypothetical protein